jgi:hypothetical protein
MEAAMPETITENIKKTYQGLVLMRGQQISSKTMKWADVKTDVGESTSWDGLGWIEMLPKSGRGAPTPRQDPTHYRRWATPVAYNAGIPIEDLDKAATLMDPTSKYVTVVGGAYGRQIDRAYFAAALGTVKTGPEAAGTETWPTTDRNSNSHQIAHGGTGFTIEKLLQGIRLMRECEVPEEIPLVFYISPQGLEDALLIDKVGSILYNSIRALQQGSMMQYAGVEWVQSNLLAKSGTTRSCILTAKGVVGVGVGRTKKVRIGENPAASYENQIYLETSVAGARLDGEKVVEIQITES